MGSRLCPALTRRRAGRRPAAARAVARLPRGPRFVAGHKRREELWMPHLRPSLRPRLLGGSARGRP
eukprot:12753317-Alexandrium_andersonii.AAC.1